MLKRMTQRSYNRITSSKLMQTLLLSSAILIIFMVMFIIPVRNVVLQYYVNKAWRNVSTQDIIHMHYIRSTYPAGIYTKVECPSKRVPSIKMEAIDTSKFIVSKINNDSNIMHDSLSKGHGRYLPFMKKEKKLDYLYLYLTMKEVFVDTDVPFFMTAGSILGATRHGGFIPWDDDLDFAFHVDQWEVIKQRLSCVEGFTLEIFAPHHWKFHYKNQTFPFIDIFMYSKHGPYLYSLAHYIAKTFIYPEHMVFPLVEIDFEGIRMPMPGQGLNIARRIYDFSQCVAFRGHVEIDRKWKDVYPDGYSKDNVPCKDLLYMHNMKNLDDEI